MAATHHKYRVHRNLSGKSISDRHERVVYRSHEARSSGYERNKVIHFALTILTFGLWGLVWWWLILKSEGKSDQLFRGFDDAYWSYLIEREQPPAALHKMKFDDEGSKGFFDA
ncbi:hypothetical protein EKG38_02250 [Shewanella canadensis]|uniref:Uncharacterized protein n=1 Tax=Shewanella canadensis TaxID=271096 RepID=A0A3S0L435_9GAMM|nr:DUF4234 domain-containing protein [Shewanella canadensis]RTR40756.1 hypothetical protein EKG38_02250 [Shewanella canadensis]